MKLHSILSKHYVVCVNNEGYEVSLEKRKIYCSVPDKQASKQGLIKVRDESGQFYLYPESFFAAIKLPHPLLKALALAA